VKTDFAAGGIGHNPPVSMPYHFSSTVEKAGWHD
jgi:hypothetical protein